ncbi:hypothetical protein WICPIJ_009537 [Wickerhamomyces pijperi]|uniref:GTP-binding protein RHO4 n=1 Tax=Wickerhamomyces pijperi TaxID=599730 RepID=A0A9P8PNR9_WICPI|nr:hypothetical protein WICPIJ_009537 [Wickerhamomyces pijperi]
MPTETIKRKLVIVGDGASGKTSLLYVFSLGEFPTEYHPTVFENYVTDCRVDGKAVQLALWDTAGQEEYERLRPLSYSRANVILIAFAVDDVGSWENVDWKWGREVQRYCFGVAVILVGLKSDLYGKEPGKKYVSWDQGQEMARRIGAKRYMTCSALTGEGVDDVFEAATRYSLLSGDDRVKESCCTIL